MALYKVKTALQDIGRPVYKSKQGAFTQSTDDWLMMRMWIAGDTVFCVMEEYTYNENFATVLLKILTPTFVGWIMISENSLKPVA